MRQLAKDEHAHEEEVGNAAYAARGDCFFAIRKLK
jgi:hypothetical protein